MKRCLNCGYKFERGRLEPTFIPVGVAFTFHLQPMGFIERCPRCGSTHIVPVRNGD